MNLVDVVVLRRADEQVAGVRRIAGSEDGRCACGRPCRKAAGHAGRKPVTCGRRACRLARQRQRRAEAARRAS